MGRPDPLLISTSYVERQNLTMRMGMRRFTRLTNAFSKKVENHAHAVAVHFLHYNFARPTRASGSARPLRWRPAWRATPGHSPRSPDCSTARLRQTEPLPDWPREQEETCRSFAAGAPEEAAPGR